MKWHADRKIVILSSIASLIVIYASLVSSESWKPETPTTPDLVQLVGRPTARARTSDTAVKTCDKSGRPDDVVFVYRPTCRNPRAGTATASSTRPGWWNYSIDSHDFSISFPGPEWKIVEAYDYEEFVGLAILHQDSAFSITILFPNWRANSISEYWLREMSAQSPVVTEFAGEEAYLYFIDGHLEQLDGRMFYLPRRDTIISLGEEDLNLNRPDGSLRDDYQSQIDSILETISLSH